MVEEIRHAAEHVGTVKEVRNVRARWLGHRLTTELDVVVANGTTVQEADAISAEVEAVVADHVQALASAHVRVRSFEGASASPTPRHAGHHNALDPIPITGTFVEGVIEIVDTPDGERMRLTAARLADHAQASVVIDRREGDETLRLLPGGKEPNVLMSANAPAEPHEFNARLIVRVGEREDILSFRMVEPAEHPH